MNRAPRALLPLVLAACAASPATPAVSAASAAAPAAPADVELRDDGTAFSGGRTIAMDGASEGLAWPALRMALDRKVGDHAPLTIAVPRTVHLASVLRAVWTLRDADLRLQTADALGAPRVIELRPKPDAPSPGCHLAVFVAPGGDLRIAAPGGPRTLSGASGADPRVTLARALVQERNQCALRYVAFGAETADAAWSQVFDVVWAVERDKSAGDARYVLAEPVH